jgi:hypothetical protein
MRRGLSAASASLDVAWSSLSPRPRRTEAGRLCRLWPAASSPAAARMLMPSLPTFDGVVPARQDYHTPPFAPNQHPDTEIPMYQCPLHVYDNCFYPEHHRDLPREP